ncbi:MAG: MFS transporter [Halieaceae bacterium]
MSNRFAWFIAGFASLALMVSNGMTISGLSVYDLAFIDRFEWSMGEIKFRDLITLALTGLLAPFAGILLDRYGVRRCMMVGWAVLALGYLAYSRLDSLVGMYAIHASFAIVLVFCGLNAVVILVSSWFVRYRGTAIGITLTGSSLGGAIFPQYGTRMMASFDWQWAMLVAVAFPLILLVITWLLIRDKPDQAPTPEVTEAEAIAAGAPADVAYADALRTTTFWALAVIAMCTFYTVLGVQAHVFKYMRDSGFDAQVATNAISLFFMCALVGKFLFGMLADMIDGRKVFYGNMIVMLIGSIILARMDIELVWIAVITFGLGWGGAYTMLQLTVMNTFGLRDAGKILGTITILDAIGGGVGIWLTGVMYDRSGSYELPFAIFAGLVAFALLCFTRVRPLTDAQKGLSPLPS